MPHAAFIYVLIYIFHGEKLAVVLLILKKSIIYETEYE